MDVRMSAPGTLIDAPTLSAADFSRVQRIAYERAGLAIPAGKEGLVRSRITKRLRERRIVSFDSYLDLVESDARGEEMVNLIDLLTTNKTDFFREVAHFDYLLRSIVPAVVAARKPLRIWSAGCSTGEEPYTLSMVLREVLPPRHDFRILATDLSTQVIATAKRGKYSASQLADVSPERRARWFAPTPDGGGEALPDLRAPISFANLNLMAPWPMSGPFDLILCRNVMIYFDKPTITTLVNRYHDLLTPGGHLFIGHSESLTAVTHTYDYVQPAVYRK
jgi:chemotaxis protein methyltransferase CheR